MVKATTISIFIRKRLCSSIRKTTKVLKSTSVAVMLCTTAKRVTFLFTARANLLELIAEAFQSLKAYPRGARGRIIKAVDQVVTRAEVLTLVKPNCTTMSMCLRTYWIWRKDFSPMFLFLFRATECILLHVDKNDSFEQDCSMRNVTSSGKAQFLCKQCYDLVSRATKAKRFLP